MKRVISAVIFISLLLSTVCGNIVFASDVLPLYEANFEETLNGWSIYNNTKDDYLNGLIGYNLNTDTDFVTEGSQSLHLYDNTVTASSTYSAVATPYIEITDFGRYTLTGDVRVLSGGLKIYIRCYKSDKNTYTQRGITIKANTAFETCSIEYTVTPATPYVRLLFISQNAEGVSDEGYCDNFKLTKTGEYDETSYEMRTSVQSQINEAQPGDVISIPDGEYKDVMFNIAVSGDADNPITLKAENSGNVILKRDSAIVISGDYVNIEGIRFEEVETSQIVYFTVDSSDSAIKDCAFFNCDPQGDDSEKQNWVMLRGQNLKVSGCFFSGKSSYTQMVEITKNEKNVGLADNHIIENCYFGNIAYQTTNGYEAIRMGSSTYSFENSKSTVQGCFFYQCNGEVETISVKSCENTIKNNTFYNNNGAVVLRHGDRNEVSGNLFIGEISTTRPTGVRVIGADHKIHDNYFYNLSLNSPVLYLFHGCSKEGISDSWYYPVENVEVYNNTVIGGDKTMIVGEYSTSSDPAFNRIIAPTGKIYNNAIVSYSGTNPLITNGDPDISVTTDEEAFHSVTFDNNYVYGKTLGYTEGGETTVPQGVNNEYFRLVQNGRYFEAENGTGADIDIVKQAPTSPFDIISDWVKEVYYDTGKVTFEAVENDPFNSQAAHINNVIPFNVSVSTDSLEDSVELYENDVLVSENSKEVSNNPTLKIVAKPQFNKEVTWFINGKLLNESNINDLGVVTDDVNSNELIINNLTENFNIEAEFNYISTIPDEISGAFSQVAGTADDENSLTVQTLQGEATITGKYVLIAKKILVSPLLNIKEWGIKVSEDGVDFKEVKSQLSLTAEGAFGMVLYNLEDGKTYKIKPYAIYLDENDNEKIIEGTVEDIID